MGSSKGSWSSWRFSIKEFPILEKEEIDGDFLKTAWRQSVPGGNQTLWGYWRASQDVEKPDSQEKCMNSSRIILWSTVKLSLELENRSECQTKRKTFLMQLVEEEMKAEWEHRGATSRKVLLRGRAVQSTWTMLLLMPCSSEALGEDHQDLERLQRDRDRWGILMWNKRSEDPEGNPWWKGPERSYLSKSTCNKLEKQRKSFTEHCVFCQSLPSAL